MAAAPMTHRMLTRARQIEDEDGFIIIEVLVSALILAIVAGAVLALITATTHSAASERNHSTAYGLAQEDQAKLRTFQISRLNRYVHTETVPIGGTSYTIESRGVFVNSKSGTSSCTESNSSADYVEITSTVSSPTLTTPVSLQSIVSPSSGSLDPSHGTIAFQVNNAVGQGVSGVSLTGSGTANFTGTTDSNGCAIFADLPSGNYKVVAGGNGLITPEGTGTWTKEQVGAPASGTQQVQIRFDTPGKVFPKFFYLEPKTGVLTSSPIDSMELFNSENEQMTLTFGAPGAAPRPAQLEDTMVFPFATKYLIYAGSCTSNKPESENTAASANVLVTPGGLSAPQIQVPALNLGVTYNGSPVQGAKVILTDTTCKYNGSNLRREFTTNKAGHIVDNKLELNTETQAVGLPIGTYSICVSAMINATEYRRAEATGLSAVTVNNLSTAASKSLALSGSSSTRSC
jgi:type II secretory pathway pseudopilin PulG